MTELETPETVCPFGLALPHDAPVLPCWYCEGKDGDGQFYDPRVHHGWACEACDERRATQKVIEAARWAHDKLNDEHDTCDCTCVACCGCFTEWLGDHKNHEEWCQLGAALRDLDARTLKTDGRGSKE